MFGFSETIDEKIIKWGMDRESRDYLSDGFIKQYCHYLENEAYIAAKDKKSGNDAFFRELFDLNIRCVAFELDFEKEYDSLSKEAHSAFFGFWSNKKEDRLKNYVNYMIRELPHIFRKNVKNNRNYYYSHFYIIHTINTVYRNAIRSKYDDNFYERRREEREKEEAIRAEKQKKEREIQRETNEVSSLQSKLDQIPEATPLEQQRYYRIMKELAELERIVKKKQWDNLNTTEQEDFVLRGGGLDG